MLKESVALTDETKRTLKVSSCIARKAEGSLLGKTLLSGQFLAYFQQFSKGPYGSEANSPLVTGYVMRPRAFPEAADLALSECLLCAVGVSTFLARGGAAQRGR